jgi:predicted lipoprotein with Yx(FWY)xxD motif
MFNLTRYLLTAALLITGTVGMTGTLNAQDTGSVLAVRSDDRLGHLLTDAAGRTLYYSSADQACLSNCIGPCEIQWPPLLLDQDHLTVTGDLPGQFSIAVRSNGDRQICYNDRPLYLSHTDMSPGDVRGHGQGGKWYAANVEPTVQQLTGTDGRPYLAGPMGMTLYSIVSDRPGVGECRRGCAENWPPLVIGHVPAAAAGLSDELGVATRKAPDRRLQVTYEGRPLYYWSRDRSVGDITGDGIGDIWSVARPGSAGQ